MCVYARDLRLHESKWNFILCTLTMKLLVRKPWLKELSARGQGGRLASHFNVTFAARLRIWLRLWLQFWDAIGLRFGAGCKRVSNILGARTCSTNQSILLSDGEWLGVWELRLESKNWPWCMSDRSSDRVCNCCWSIYNQIGWEKNTYDHSSQKARPLVRSAMRTWLAAN